MEHFEAAPYDDWQQTKETLHRFVQIVGKVRLATSARRNHWWNVPFHLTASGITTRPMGADPTFAVDFDFVDHRVLVQNTDGRRASFSLPGQSVASFHRELLAALRAIGAPDAAETIVDAHPFDLPDAARAFADDTEHAAYDTAAVSRYWRVLSDVNLVLEEFSGRFSGKTSPVHHFWHTFDIAATRFSDVVVPHSADADPVTREAYSREVISVGFWFGDPSYPAPAWYAYTSPEPEGLAEEPLPGSAQWLDRGASHLAVVSFDETRASGDPRGAALDFLQAAYEAGARRAGWDIDRYACVDGVTAAIL
jgi:hypothetical protein